MPSYNKGVQAFLFGGGVNIQILEVVITKLPPPPCDVLAQLFTEQQPIAKNKNEKGLDSFFVCFSITFLVRLCFIRYRVALQG